MKCKDCIYCEITTIAKCTKLGTHTVNTTDPSLGQSFAGCEPTKEVKKNVQSRKQSDDE